MPAAAQTAMLASNAIAAIKPVSKDVMAASTRRAGTHRRIVDAERQRVEARRCEPSARRRIVDANRQRARISISRSTPDSTLNSRL
jgi:hypothetical protein